jgi:acetoin utilization protein AcuC
LSRASADAVQPFVPPSLAGETRFVTSDIFRQPAFGRNHPLSIARQSGVLDLCEQLGWLEPGHQLTCEPATVDTLTRFHDLTYVEALKRASERGMATVEERERYAFGTMENPLFPGLFERAASTVDGAIRSAEVALAGGTAFHPAGGTHHGRRDRACGFCYFNDPVFAILTLLEGGAERVMYIDLDAHHGDGVQIAYAEDERVLCLSVHEANRWPHTGAVDDRGEGMARNLPVPPGFNDRELDFVRREAIEPLLAGHAPDVLVLTCGADSLAGDPLSTMEISNGAMWRTVTALADQAPSVVLGGGGYNPWTAVRFWAGLWGHLAGMDWPAVLPSKASALLAGFDCDLVDEEDIESDWLTRLEDSPNAGVVRDEVRTLVETVRKE